MGTSKDAPAQPSPGGRWIVQDNDTLLRRIDAYCDDKGITPSKFGRLAMDDVGFVSNLRDGRRLRPSTRNRLIRWLDGATD